MPKKPKAAGDDEKTGRAGEKAANQRAEGSPKPATARSLLKKAYQRLGSRLDEAGNGKAIDDLAKLVKLEKEIAGENRVGKKTRLRWERGNEGSGSG